MAAAPRPMDVAVPRGGALMRAASVPAATHLLGGCSDDVLLRAGIGSGSLSRSEGGLLGLAVEAAAQRDAARKAAVARK